MAFPQEKPRGGALSGLHGQETCSSDLCCPAPTAPPDATVSTLTALTRFGAVPGSTTAVVLASARVDDAGLETQVMTLDWFRLSLLLEK